MSLAREGYPFAAAGLLLAGLAWAGLLTTETALLLPLACLLTGGSLFVLWFFRDPAPRVPGDEALVVAPGQGKVIRIESVDEPTFVGERAHKISIFLSVFDVHVQRAPVTGTVGHKEYRPGKYVVAWADKASEDNEMCTLGIETENGRVEVRQIAGLVARRIITDPEVGDSVERGKRFGLIRFGSRVDIFLPEHWSVDCAVGDKVRVGSSILATQKAAVRSTEEASP